ncbi:hypothetical protein C7449_101631 [Mycoplana dimorpha]|uniref:Uncharacterized protein n=1 Tax=Mycoplana dimorpha TaxID=28320 RepID=A0A2T5BIZ9_MYCDI|nr:hypothetical protein C7449_101631 [Mycoplana dimorpha]
MECNIRGIGARQCVAVLDRNRVFLMGGTYLRFERVQYQDVANGSGIGLSQLSSLTKRYPTPGSVRMIVGAAGSRSTLLRNWPMNTLR